MLHDLLKKYLPNELGKIRLKNYLLTQTSKKNICQGGLKTVTTYLYDIFLYTVAIITSHHVPAHARLDQPVSWQRQQRNKYKYIIYLFIKYINNINN